MASKRDFKKIESWAARASNDASEVIAVKSSGAPIELDDYIPSSDDNHKLKSFLQRDSDDYIYQDLSEGNWHGSIKKIAKLLKLRKIKGKLHLVDDKINHSDIKIGPSDKRWKITSWSVELKKINNDNGDKEDVFRDTIIWESLDGNTSSPFTSTHDWRIYKD